MPYQEHSFAFDDTEVFYLEGGAGFPLLLIHGSGPGASTAGNWRPILEPLAQHFHVFAMDLVGFGRSGRKPAPPYFDFELWFRQGLAMLARIPGEQVGIIGHSLSGALALKLAAANPRVAGLVTTGSMGAKFQINEATAQCWTFPETVEELRAVAGILIHDKSLIDDAYIAAREKVLYGEPGYGAYFNAMFDGDKQAYADAAVLAPDELARINCPVTLLHGRDDIAFPPEITIEIARHLPQADIVLISQCSHSIALEHTSRLLAEALTRFGTH